MRDIDKCAIMKIAQKIKMENKNGKPTNDISRQKYARNRT